MSIQRNKIYNEQNVSEDRVLLVGVHSTQTTLEDTEASLDELARLVDTLGGVIAKRIICKRKTPSPAMYIGKGKAEEIAEFVAEEKVDVVAFDVELTGNQQKNLENVFDCRVIDRTGVILDIFSRHARTKEAKNQVELASLEYLASHLSKRWQHLERQRGGIGMRGVGERQIELDRRMIRSRISRLKEELRHTEGDRTIQRRHRKQFLQVAIVGYTNAGKSTLMNNLTQAEVYVDDRLFATLDPTVRVIDPKTRPPIMLSDTVGFIRKLPHSLVASFRSTLQEVIEADLLLHVVDVSSPQYMDQIQVTQEVLEEMGAGKQPSMIVFNKADLVREVFLPKILERAYIDSLVVSALRPADMQRLRDAIDRYFERDMVEVEFVVSYQDSQLQSQVYENAKVLEKAFLDEGTKLRVRILRSTLNRLRIKEKTQGWVEFPIEEGAKL